MDSGDTQIHDYDVVVVGGGPAGCSAAVFTARYGLDTVVFDRGNSSIRRCAHLENYLGFPAGIDVETLYGLMHDHVEEAGGDLVADMVESVERDGEARSGSDDRTDAGDVAGGFVVGTQDGRTVTARRVVAAARYDADFLRPLGEEEAMFVVHDQAGEEHEHFDSDYPARDGTTPIDGLYVAAPAGDADAQAITSAGQGARVGRTIVADVRRERGYPADLAAHWDWLRRETELTGEWADRDRWREYADSRRPDDHDLSDERWETLRERDIDRRFDSYVSDGDVDRRAERGQRRLLDHVDDELVLQAARDIEAEREPTEREE